jgi:hypothetical protein
MTKTAEGTPVRRALRKDSSLLPSVQDGLGAVKSKHRDYFEEAIRSAFADSLDADEALREGHDRENRWDYLLGHGASQALIGVEPHSAKEDEISAVIKKRAAVIEQLRTHLREGVKIAKWLWVASGKVHFASTEKARFRLDQNGIEFVGKRVMAKHVPAVATTTGTQVKPTRRRKK